MVCRLCGSNNINTIHKGTRDRKDIDVLKCSNCGLVFLSKITTNDDYYIRGGMRQELNFAKWRDITYNDDLRRFNYFKEMMTGKSIMDFGCGNGGFLEMAKTSGAVKIIGVEHDNEACEKLQASGINCYQDIANVSVDEKFDVIFTFHVIEHLPEPEELLCKLKKHMTKDGILIIETPNANDALLSVYECDSFADFTYWSPHIYLYNENTLETVINRADMKVVEMKQIQRYPLANHLLWLAKGLLGGGVKEYRELNNEAMNVEYERVLSRNKVCDTLLCVVKS